MPALGDRVFDKGVPRGGFSQFIRSLNGTPPLTPIFILTRPFLSYSSHACSTMRLFHNFFGVNTLSPPLKVILSHRNFYI